MFYISSLVEETHHWSIIKKLYKNLPLKQKRQKINGSQFLSEGQCCTSNKELFISRTYLHTPKRALLLRTEINISRAGKLSPLFQDVIVWHQFKKWCQISNDGYKFSIDTQ